ELVFANGAAYGVCARISDPHGDEREEHQVAAVVGLTEQDEVGPQPAEVERRHETPQPRPDVAVGVAGPRVSGGHEPYRGDEPAQQVLLAACERDQGQCGGAACPGHGEWRAVASAGEGKLNAGDRDGNG